MIALVRHGRTAHNRAQRLQGRIDAELDDTGVHEAERLGVAFASEPVRQVFASPLRRALQTATPIAAAHGLDVVTDDRLVELDYGEWDERGLADIAPEDWARWRADSTFAPPGGESLGDVAARVVDFCCEHLRDELVVAVTHVSPIKAAICWALDVDQRATWRMFLGVASISRVGCRDGKTPYLASFNETVTER